MRIRRSAKLSPAKETANGTCPEDILQAHVCRLNQSPWDVAIIAQSSSNAQREARDFEDFSFARIASSQRADSIAAVESITSSLIGTGAETTIAPVKRRRRKKKKKKMTESPPEQTVDTDNDKSKTKPSKRNKASMCQKNDGKGWQCKREVKVNGNNFCEHHMSLFRSYNAAASETPVEESKSTGMTRRTRGAPKRPTPLTSNPYEYYYYSGFGPRWRRRHGGARGASPETVSAGEDHGKGDDSARSSSTTTTAVDGNLPVSTGEVEFMDYEDEDDDDEDSDGDGGDRKRVRRPVKARSLKSLM